MLLKLSPKNVLSFIQRTTEDFSNYHFIPQWLKEMKIAYLGNEKLSNNTIYYPNNIKHKYYKENKVLFPLNAKVGLII